jgi:hypothetical protein
MIHDEPHKYFGRKWGLERSPTFLRIRDFFVFPAKNFPGKPSSNPMVQLSALRDVRLFQHPEHEPNDGEPNRHRRMNRRPE